MAFTLPLERCNMHGARSVLRAGPRSCVGHPRRSTVTVSAGLGDFFSAFLDGSWAPKSTRIWRTQSFEFASDEPGGAGGPAGSGDEATDLAMDDLQARVNSVPAAARPALGGADGADAGTADNSGFDGSSPATRSFSETDDGYLAAALSRRIGEIASTTASDDSEVVEEEARQPLSAAELRELIYAKYGKTYDVSFVRRDIPGKTFVSLNIMWIHLEQRSFKLTEKQYMEKLDGVAYLVGALGQTDKVRAFLREPARSQKGLPPRPVVGTAISIRFDLDDSVIKEWFGNGYQ